MTPESQITQLVLEAQDLRKRYDLLATESMDKIEKLEARLELATKRAERAEDNTARFRDIFRKIDYRGNFLALGTKQDEAQALIRLHSLVETGTHMEVFKKTIAENQMVSQAWDDFMMALRLTGFDGTNDG